MSDIVERLQAHMGKAEIKDVLPDCREAAAEILRLRRELSEARNNALEEAAKVLDSKMYDYGCIAGEEAFEFVELCAELAAAIRKLKETGE